jgi:hypothetical protein
MDEQSLVTEVSVLAPEAHTVLDAAVGRWLAEHYVAYDITRRLGLKHSSMASGFSCHALTHHNVPVWQVYLRATDLKLTVIQLVVPHQITQDVLQSQLAAFWEWYIEDQERARQLPLIGTLSKATQALTVQEARAMAPGPRPRGPSPAPLTLWVREEIRNGRNADDLLPEYMQRRGEHYADHDARRRAREALRKTIERGRSR